VKSAWSGIAEQLQGLGVELDELASVAAARTLRRFERAGLEPDAASFEDAVSRVALADLALAIAWERGDAAAWERYTTLHRDSVLRAARAQGASPADAEELADGLPGTLLSAGSDGSSPLARYDGSGSLRGWLCTIARRRVADGARRGARRVELVEGAEVDGAPRPAQAAERQEASDRIVEFAARLRQELTLKERLALLLKHEQGLPQRAIAAQLGVSDSRVTRLLQHATDKLRERLVSTASAVEREDPTWIQELVLALGKPGDEGQRPATPRDPEMPNEG